jgi:hypothetical protein
MAAHRWRPPGFHVERIHFEGDGSDVAVAGEGSQQACQQKMAGARKAMLAQYLLHGAQTPEGYPASQVAEMKVDQPSVERPTRLYQIHVGCGRMGGIEHQAKVVPVSKGTEAIQRGKDVAPIRGGTDGFVLNR